MRKWFRPGPPPHQTALAMIGVKAGDRLVIAGRPEPALAAELARLTGLNGRTLVVNQGAAARASLQAAADAAGVLLELAEGPEPALPGDDGSADVAIVATSTRADEIELREAFRLLRRGGRLLVVEGTRRKGLFAKDGETPPHAEAVVQSLLHAGGRAARRLGTAEGVTYYETRK